LFEWAGLKNRISTGNRIFWFFSFFVLALNKFCDRSATTKKILVPNLTLKNNAHFAHLTLRTFINEISKQSSHTNAIRVSQTAKV
jgi:hypothetical protein